MQPGSVCGGLGHCHPLLAPKNAGQLLDEVVLGWTVWLVLGCQTLQQFVVLAPILPGQHQVPRQDAMSEGVVPATFVAPGLSRHWHCLDAPAAHVQNPFAFRWLPRRAFS